MSLSQNGRDIACDGEGCWRRVGAPVALRPLLVPDVLTPQARAGGWLFVTALGRSMHYCPGCAARFLAEMSKESVYV